MTFVLCFFVFGATLCLPPSFTKNAEHDIISNIKYITDGDGRGRNKPFRIVYYYRRNA